MHLIGGSRTSAYFYSNTTETLRFGTDIGITGSVTAPSGSIQVYSRTNLGRATRATAIHVRPCAKLGQQRTAAVGPVGRKHGQMPSYSRKFSAKRPGVALARIGR